MQERFKQLLEEKNLTATRFAAMINVNASAMSHILNGRSKPSFDLLDKIIQAFPDINLNWLISGEGAMLNRIKQPTAAYTAASKSLSEDKTKEVSPPQPEGEIPLPPDQPKIQSFPAVIPSAVSTKKIKRIIIFFEDGSFEDYEK